MLAVNGDDVTFPPTGDSSNHAMHVTVQNACGGTSPAGDDHTCAGPWDVVATASNTTKVNGTYTTTHGEPFTAKAVFSLYRWSRLTTNVSLEPVRRGAP